MSNFGQHAVHDHPEMEADTGQTPIARNRVKGLSSWRGAKIGTWTLPLWVALLVVIQILVDAPDASDMDSGQWFSVAAVVAIFGAVYGFFFGLLSGAMAGLACELFGPKAAFAAGVVVPLATAIFIMEKQFNIETWDSPSEHPLAFAALVVATVMPLIVIARQHAAVLDNHAQSPTKYQRGQASL